MAFSISSAAAEVIRQRIQDSSVDRPIAGMVDVSEMRPSTDLGKALSRNADPDELRQLAKRDLALGKMKFHLSVVVYSKSQHPLLDSHRDQRNRARLAVLGEIGVEEMDIGLRGQSLFA